jgi:microcystin-dependent protein
VSRSSSGPPKPHTGAPWEPTFFTVLGDYRSVVADGTIDLNIDPDVGPVTATVTFTPVLESGDAILASKADPRPTVYVPVPIVGHISADGRLKLRDAPSGVQENHEDPSTLPTAGVEGVAYTTLNDRRVYRWDGSTYIPDYDYTPIRLLADTALLELDGPLFYHVAFTDVLFNGEPGYLSPFTFAAPDVDIDLNIADVARRPGETAVGVVRVGPTGVRINDDGDVVFSIGGRDIPDPLKLVTVSVNGPAGPAGPPGPQGVASPLPPDVALLPDVTASSVRDRDYADVEVTKLRGEMLSALTGLVHGVSVLSIVNDAPTTPPPAVGDVFIVSNTPAGVFASHANAVASLTPSGWTFHDPDPREAHLNEADNAMWSWNGTQWVKIGSVAKSSLAGDIHAAGPKSIPVGDDEFVLADSEDAWAAKNITWAALIAAIDAAITKAKLVDLPDVEVSSPDDADALRWNESTSRWEASPMPMSSISDVDDTDTPAEGDSLVFDSATGLWTPKPLTVGDLADAEVTSAAKGDVLGFDGTGWVEHTPALVDCYDVDLTTPPADGEVLTWDGSAWVASPTGVGSGPVVADLEDLQDVNVGVPNDGDMLTWDQGEWIAAKPRLADLTDVEDDESGNATGDVLTWDADTQKWIASAPAEPVPDGSVDKDVLSWDTTTQDWVPRQQTLSGLSDVQADSAAAGDVLSFNGSGWQEKTLAISDLDDVNTTGVLVPAVNDGLAWDGAHWVPSKAAATGYTKPEVDQLLIDTAKTVNDRVDAAVLGMVHGTAVLAILSTPPATPVEGQSWIVGRAATGAWATHENKIASWVGGAWAFLQPDTKATHLVEDQAALYSFNGTSWVKVASTVAASGTTAQRGVGEIIPWALDTIPADYLECKGQIVSTAAYPDLYAVIGNRYNAGTAADGVSTFALPDLQGYFLRGVGGSGGEANVGAVQGDTTRKPNTNFTVTSTGTTSTTGSHHHDFWRSAANFSGDGKYRDTQFSPINQVGTGTSVTTGIQNAGDHSHTVTVNGNVVGGDAETRPKSVSVRWVMRVLPVNGGAVGPEGKPGVGVPAVTTADNEKVMTVVAGAPAWAAPTKRGVGEIVPWALDTIPADYLECKGQILAVTTYADLYAVIGNAYNTGTAADGTSTFALPDLRGYFLRGAGARGGEGRAGVVQDDTTRLPRTAFTGTTDSAGSHRHGFTDNHRPVVTDLGGHDLAVGPGGNAEGAFNVAADGAHTHTVTFGGGDPETRPKNFSVRWVIRVLPINGGAAGPAGTPGAGVPAITAADENKTLQVAAGTAVWKPVAAASSGPKVYSNRSYVDLADGANNYVLEGGVWMLTTGYLTLKCWSDAGVTQLTPDPATWKLQGHTYESMAAESTFTTDSVTANLITTRGWDVVNKDITMGKNWVGSGGDIKWMKFRLFVNTTAINTRDNHPYIQAEWEYTSDQNNRCTGGLTFSPPTPTI